VQYRNPLRGLTRLDAVRKRWLVWSVVAWVVSGVVVPCANAAERRVLLQAPDAVTLAWDANAPSDNVTGYFASHRTAVTAETFVPVPSGTTFTVTGLALGQRHFFKVYAVNANGRSEGSNEVFKDLAAPPDTTAPTAPASLTGTAASSSQINLSWPACTDNVAVTAYEILRNQLPRATVPSTQTTYSDVGLPPATTFTYAVRCTDAAGNLSTESPNAIVTTLGDTTAPSIPGNLVATVTTTSACLTWTASTDNLSVQGYRISREGANPALTPGLNFCENGLTPKTAYLYSLTAFDHAGNHSIPATVTATTQALPAPCATNGKTYAITIANVNYPKVIGRGSRDRVLFDLANSFPVSRVQVLLGSQVVGEAPIGGAILPGVDLRDIPGLRFSAPAVAGSHNLFIRATDNQGCTTTTTLIRPLVVQ
jgi:chitodextrinase